jgi:predicted enzyme related to lactoylglutathione lyase
MNGTKKPGAGSGFSICIDDITIDCVDPQKLGDFYAELLGWEKTALSENCVEVRMPGQAIRFLCEREEDYVPPVWPEVPGAQQKMLHFDFTVSDLDKAVLKAEALGAVRTQKQYNPKQWITMLDPAGHPFCLCRPE